MSKLTEISLQHLLNAPLSEPQAGRAAINRMKRRAFERDYTAELIKKVLLRHEEQPFTDLLHAVWRLDKSVEDYIVVSVFYESFSGSFAKTDERNVCYRLTTADELGRMYFCEQPDTGTAKMTALYALATNRDGLRENQLLQTVYDQEHTDLASRVAVWELLNTGEIKRNDRGIFHLGGI